MSEIDKNEARARQGYLLMNVARIVGLGLILAGIAATQGAINVSAEIGWVLAIAGFFGFFMLPSLIAKRIKANQSGNPQ